MGEATRRYGRWLGRGRTAFGGDGLFCSFAP